MQGVKHKNLLFVEQKGKCYYCGCDLAELEYNDITVDHKQSRFKGGESVFENKCLCCRSCNSSKGKKTTEEYEEYLKPFRMGIVSRENLSEFNKMLMLNKKYEKELYEYGSSL